MRLTALLHSGRTVVRGWKAEPLICVSRDIPVPAGRIFSVLARPAALPRWMHPGWCGLLRGRRHLRGRLRLRYEHVQRRLGETSWRTGWSNSSRIGASLGSQSCARSTHPSSSPAWMTRRPASGMAARTVGRRLHSGHRVLRLQPFTGLAAGGDQRRRELAGGYGGQPEESREADRRVLTKPLGDAGGPRRFSQPRSCPSPRPAGGRAGRVSAGRCHCRAPKNDVW